MVDSPDKIYINSDGKKVSICDDIEFLVEEDYKSTLMANLYSTVEFLKGELKQKNIIIQNLFLFLQLENKSVQLIETGSTTKSTQSNNNIIIDEWRNNSRVSHDDNHINETNINNVNESHNSHHSNPEENMSEVSTDTMETKAKLDEQLSTIRTEKRNEFHISTNEFVATSPLINEDKNNHTWPINTLLIASDSIMNSIDEKRLNRSDVNVKVRSFSGSTIADMYDYIKPLLRKQPTHLLLHVGSNDAPFKTSNLILDEYTNPT